jgi:hypothetical protein
MIRRPEARTFCACASGEESHHARRNWLNFGAIGGPAVNSLKTGVIIAFGLTVLYGVYLVINKPEPSAEAQAAAEQTPDLDIGEVGEADSTAETEPAKQDNALLETDGPAVEVADSGKPASKFNRDRSAPPLDVEESTTPKMESEEPLDPSSEAETTTPAWRRKREAAAAPEEAPPEEEKVTEPAVENNANTKQETDEPANNERAPKPDGISEESGEPAGTESKEEAQEEVKIAPSKAPPLTAAEFDAAWTKMESEIEQEKLKEALTTISPFYHATDLSDDDYKHLVEVLDLLAWRVIFSKEHFLAKPHIVKAGETLEDIAQRYRVPSEVITKINGIKSAKLLTAGTELKVVPGPFRAEVSAESGELTLFLGDLYATRYAMETGSEPPPEAGEYSIRERALGAVYRTRENRDIAAQDKRNPYGGYYLDLGNGQCLHGSPEEEEGEALGTGCMRLRGKDAKEVYWLLSKGSKVTVLR